MSEYYVETYKLETIENNIKKIIQKTISKRPKRDLFLKYYLKLGDDIEKIIIINLDNGFKVKHTKNKDIIKEEEFDSLNKLNIFIKKYNTDFGDNRLKFIIDHLTKK